MNNEFRELFIDLVCESFSPELCESFCNYFKSVDTPDEIENQKIFLIELREFWKINANDWKTWLGYAKWFRVDVSKVEKWIDILEKEEE